MKRTLIIDGKPVEIDDGATLATVEPWWARVGHWWRARNKNEPPQARHAVPQPGGLAAGTERYSFGWTDPRSTYGDLYGPFFPHGTTRREALETLEGLTHLAPKAFATLVNEANKLP